MESVRQSVFSDRQRQLMAFGRSQNQFRLEKSANPEIDWDATAEAYLAERTMGGLDWLYRHEGCSAFAPQDMMDQHLMYDFVNISSDKDNPRNQFSLTLTKPDPENPSVWKPVFRCEFYVFGLCSQPSLERIEVTDLNGFDGMREAVGSLLRTARKDTRCFGLSVSLERTGPRDMSAYLSNGNKKRRLYIYPVIGGTVNMRVPHESGFRKKLETETIQWQCSGNRPLHLCNGQKNADMDIRIGLFGSDGLFGDVISALKPRLEQIDTLIYKLRKLDAYEKGTIYIG